MYLNLLLYMLQTYLKKNKTPDKTMRPFLCLSLQNRTPERGVLINYIDSAYRSFSLERTPFVKNLVSKNPSAE